MSISRFLKNMTVAVGVAAAALAVTHPPMLSRSARSRRAARVKIGVLTGAPPMGMVDEKGNPSGYDVDVANLIGSYLSLPVELVPLTPPARIPRSRPVRSTSLLQRLRRPRARQDRDVYAALQRLQHGYHTPARTRSSRISTASRASACRVNRGSSQETALAQGQYRRSGNRCLRGRFHQRPGTACSSGRCRGTAFHSRRGESSNSVRKPVWQVGFTFFQQGNSMATKLEISSCANG